VCTYKFPETLVNKYWDNYTKITQLFENYEKENIVPTLLTEQRGRLLKIQGFKCVVKQGKCRSDSARTHAHPGTVVWTGGGYTRVLTWRGNWPLHDTKRWSTTRNNLDCNDILTAYILLLSKMAVFWVVAPCRLVEVYQRFRGPSCNPEDSHLRTHRRENLKPLLSSSLHIAIKYQILYVQKPDTTFWYLFLCS
jgi:hypothetical protein